MVIGRQHLILKENSINSSLTLSVGNHFVSISILDTSSQELLLSKHKNFKNFVTDDYVLYEMGQIMSADDFIAFAKSFNTIEDDWTLSDMKISIDKNSAHAYFKNKGRFVSLNNGKKELSNYEWHESAYLVRVGDELKIKFYFSDTINQTTEPLN